MESNNIGIITERALEILNEYAVSENMPASISGKHHIGETRTEHLQLAVNVMSHLCNEFNIHGEDRDMLIASTYLHDIGIYVISSNKKVHIPGWKEYETGWSRHGALMQLHPLIGSAVLEMYDIPRKKEIQRLVSIHMSHWYKMCPQPETLYEYLICTADYIASRGQNILKYEKERAD